MYISPPTTIPINITGKKITVQSNFIIPQDAFNTNKNINQNANTNENKKINNKRGSEYKEQLEKLKDKKYIKELEKQGIKVVSVNDRDYKFIQATFWMEP